MYHIARKQNMHEPQLQLIQYKYINNEHPNHTAGRLTCVLFPGESSPPYGPTPRCLPASREVQRYRWQEIQ